LLGERIQRGLLHRERWVRAVTVLALCLAAGVPVGAILGLLGAIYGSAVLFALALAYLMMRSITVGLIVLAGIICLLPFAAVPIDIGFSPTFLDLALALVFFVWISRLVTHKEGEFIAPVPTGAILVFMGLALVSFIAGLSHSPLTANVVRHFVEILLSVAVFWLVTNTLRRAQDVRLVTLALILAGFAAAAIGIVLYVLPETLAIRVLSALRVVRYPSGPEVLRYVEDDPSLPLRAISTSVDPNILGGMLIFVTTLTAAQVLAPQPILKRGWLILMLVTMVTCMVLTFSRGSFAGLVVALVLLSALRYPKMLWYILAGIVVLLVLPPSRAYVEHFIEGVQGQDLATQMRFGEYKDALILISRYPWFGVGFAGTPDIDTYLGVSNVYLLIAEEMGVIGLSAFLVAMGSFLHGFFARLALWRRRPDLEPIVLGAGLAVVGALIGGILDHYLFNLNFPHAAALLWFVVGLGAAGMRLIGLEPRPAP